MRQQPIKINCLVTLTTGNRVQRNYGHENRGKKIRNPHAWISLPGKQSAKASAKANESNVFSFVGRSVNTREYESPRDRRRCPAALAFMGKHLFRGDNTLPDSLFSHSIDCVCSAHVMHRRDPENSHSRESIRRHFDRFDSTIIWRREQKTNPHNELITEATW